MNRIWLTLTLLFFVSSSAFVAQTATAASRETPPVAPASAKVADLSFMAGSWEGRADDARIEQTCSVSDPAVMVCMFRAMDAKGTQMVEFYTLRDTPNGVEERVRFFSPDLKEEPGDGLTMKLAGSSPTTFVFENPTGTYPKRSTLTRTSPDALHSHIELVDPQGKTSTIDAYWKRASK